MWRMLAMACVLAACSPAPASKTNDASTPVVVPPAPTAADNNNFLDPASTWTCADGRTLSVTFYADPDRVEIVEPNGAKLDLTEVFSASGALYDDGAHTFHTKGDEALLTFGGKSTTCRKAPSSY